MARKRLIKGANATRVEERIARVPVDVSEASPVQSIFGALRAMEEGSAQLVTPVAEQARAPSLTNPEPKARAEPRGRRPPERKRASKKTAASTPLALRPEPPKAVPQPVLQEPAPDKADAVTLDPAIPAVPDKPARHNRIGPSDFSAAERAEIVRCCSDYRNRLPTYLLAVQVEVEVIDSVIDKCRTTKNGEKT